VKRGGGRHDDCEGLFDQAYTFARRSAQARAAAISPFDGALLDREDLEQEALVSVYIALPKFDARRATLRTFVERVITNAMTSAQRRATARKRTSSSESSPQVHVLLRVDLRLDLDRLLQRLQPQDRRIAWLLCEFRPAEVARITAISRPAVYRSIKRIREALMDGGFK